tara:strand:- start:262 stop:540 length:279 start_codon:yes stop_codon:yes gene_type:complete
MDDINLGDSENRDLVKEIDQIKDRFSKFEKRLERIERRENKRVSTPWGVFDKDTMNWIYIIMVVVLLGFGGIIGWAYFTESWIFEPLDNSYP